jgi:hypothetical protein
VIVNNTSENLIRLFGMTGHMLTEDFAKIEAEFDVELGHAPRQESHESDSYYQQFSLAVRSEARMMATHYEVFYCLEKDTRDRVAQAMEDQLGTDWWSSGKVPAHIMSEVQKRIQREADAGVTRRSADPLDYTTFGELSGIITANWDIFGAIFSSQKAVEKVMSSLNSLRGSIAHCSPLAPDEVLRLRLTLRDWFRLME